MSHIHFADGAFPVWLWAAGYALVIVLVGILWQRGKATANPGRFALLGIMAAIMVLIMSIEVPPGLHVNLSVAAGIILGGRLGVLAALIVNILLSFLGHGGITVVGLNTLVLSTEMMVGYAVFRLLVRVHRRVAVSGFVATLAGLASGTALSFGLIVLAAPWINTALATGSVDAEHYGPHIVIPRLAALMFGLGAIGWVVEAFLTAAILTALRRIDPRLVGVDQEE